MPGPTFSVVVPTFERRRELARLLELLALQTYRDFELVIGDQGAIPTVTDVDAHPYQIRHLRLAERGATRARNRALMVARGHFIAFTDDDCEPAPDWLSKALRHLDRRGVAGIEGRVECDQTDRSRYRVVTNRGFEGIGFMTANLFMRKDVLDALGGFDERLEDPHFREDTDLGWRALEHGALPFAEDVRVMHPAPPIDSWHERLRFFIHDALLSHKHPGRFLELLRVEGHYLRPGYWRVFMEGIVRHGCPVPMTQVRQVMPPSVFRLCEELCAFLDLERASG